MFDLYTYKERMDFSDIKLTPKEAILAKCYDCCVYDGKEVKLCASTHCPLYQFKEKWFKIPRQKNLNDKRRYNTFK